MRRILLGIAVWSISISSLWAQTELKMPKSDWDKYYHNATVGDFVQYVNKDGTPNNRKEVTAVGDHKISVTYTVWLDAKLKNEFRQVYVFSEPDRPQPALDEVKASSETIKAAGHEFKCEKKEYWSKFGPKKDKPTKTEWRSDQAPFDGLVKLEQFSTLELQSLKYAKAPK